MDAPSTAEALSAATGTSLEEASALLEAAEGDLERAAHLYFSGEGKEDGIRPPDTAKMDVLYGSHPLPTRIEDAVDAFQGFKDDSRELSKLFASPDAILFRGGLEKAKEHACEQGRWLLANVQSPTEFASHRLNRDLWSDDLVQSTVKASFVFWQTYHNGEEGAKACNFYKLDHLPVIMVIDPVTGQKLVQWEGYVSPEKLMENLLPFLDRGPLERGPPPVSMKRLRSMEASTSRKHVHEELGIAGEEADLATAIAASLEPMQQRGKHDVPTEDTVVESNKEDEVEDSELESLLQAARELRPEPDPGDSQSCRIAVRIPTGGRIQRRFLRTQRVKLLYVYCMQEVEEAQRGRTFQISPAVPGSQPLTDMDATIEEAGVADSMLNMNWSG